MQPIHVALVLIVAVPLFFVMRGRLRIDVAALLMAVMLGGLQLAGVGVLGPANTPENAVKAISGFSQPVVITLISLFIVTRGLEKSGASRWLARQMLRLTGPDETRLILLFAALSALFSIFMNNLAAAALVLPSALEAARRTGVRPSKLLIPVAYGSLLGGVATYFTTANIIVSDLLTIAHPPQAPLGFAQFLPTGGLIAVCGILLLGFLGKYLLPDREPAISSSASRRTEGELETLYQIHERLWEARVHPGSPLAGKTLQESQIGERYGVSVAEIRRDIGRIVFPAVNQALHTGDTLLLIGREDKVMELQSLGLAIAPAHTQGAAALRDIAHLEVLLAPHSNLEGKTLKQIDFRQHFGMSVIALKRGPRSYRTDVGDIPLRMGDSLLAIGKPEHIQALRRRADFILIEPEHGDQPVNRRQALWAAALTAGAIIASLAGAPVYLATLAAAVLTLLLRVLPTEEAYQAVEWQAIFLVAGMYAVSIAMIQTGLAGWLGNGVLAFTRPFGPLGLAAGAFLLTAALTQVMGGQVTALVTGPITISAAIAIGANPQAIAVATAIGCSASFTPLAHPVNILVIAPGNYQFNDFLRAGWPLTLLSFAALLAGMVWFWGM